MHLGFYSLLGVAALGLTGPVSLCADARADGMVNRGANEVYALFCASCHGEDMRGQKVASLLDGNWREGGTDADLLRVIRDGLPNSGMPAFGGALNEAEMRALIVYIRETARRTKEPTPTRAEPLPEGVIKGELHGWRVELVAEDFDVPWSLAFLPDGRMLVTDRIGTLHVVSEGRVDPAPISGLPRVWVRDEAGLMSVVPHPDFAENGWVYLSFSDPGPDDTAMTKIVRGWLRDGAFTEQETIFEAPPETYSSKGINFGGRLLFHGEHLFFTVGERGALGAAQDLKRPNGKVHRVYHDGRVPADNPFAGRDDALGSIWSLGHRNPQGLALDAATGALWESEHGPRGGDELNHVMRGKNYGWPLATHGMNYDGTPVSAHTELPGMEPPAVYWTPSIAVGALHFYDGGEFPRWRNQLFVGSLAQQKLIRMETKDGRITHQELVLEKLGRIRDIKTGPEGYLYLLLEIPGPYPGRIIRLRPAE